MLNETSIMHTESLNSMQGESAMVYMRILDFLMGKNFFDLCGESVSWRFLDGMQYSVLEIKCFNNFKTLHTETHKYIMSCPYLNIKTKILMWCLDNNLDFIVIFFVKLRNLFRN